MFHDYVCMLHGSVMACSVHGLTQVAVVCSTLCHPMYKDVTSFTVLREKGI